MPAQSVLLVDDDDLQRKVCAVDLQAGGFEVLEAATAEEALGKARMYGPAVIVLDVMLPGKDGFECLRELRADPILRRIPVVMLTAKDQLDDELEGMTSGADRYLTKPVHPGLLVGTVKSVATKVSG